MPHIPMQHDEDPKQTLLKALGDFKKLEVFNNQVLCAVYIRPEKTKGGIVLPEQHLQEDRSQSKVGLVIKMGPDAFQDSSGSWFKDTNIQIHDWVFFKPSDGWGVTVNGVLCRMLDDINVRGRISHSDLVW